MENISAEKPSREELETALQKAGFKYVITDDSVTITGLNVQPETLEIPYGVTSIGDCAFSRCESLTSITIPNSVRSIGVDAFCCCSLTSLTLPDGLTHIGNTAFSGCCALRSITIPQSVHDIGADVFDWCWDVTIFGLEGSYIHLYAEANRLKFQAISQNGPNRTSPRTFRPGTIAGEQLMRSVDGVTYLFRWCPSGTFRMGAPKEESSAPWRWQRSSFEYDEHVHDVTLTSGFWMLETPVTQDMWESLMHSNPCYFKDPDCPVDKVSWFECKLFCRKLADMLNMNVSLPTEAQWEYACRAGTTGPYAVDQNEIESYLKSKTLISTHRVRYMSPNAWGLSDMHGNVWEWCLDVYEPHYYLHSPICDPKGPEGEHSSARVCRGCWEYNYGDCRSAFRSSNSPNTQGNRLGFRVVLNDIE